jgi:hypothetical protein
VNISYDRIFKLLFQKVPLKIREERLVMRNPNLENSVKSSRKNAIVPPHTSNPLILQIISVIDDLHVTQKQLQYFAKEVKLWTLPQKKL